jgi:hypothetical protein
LEWPGCKIHHLPVSRGFNVDEDRVNAMLQKGRNTLLMRVFNLGLDWKACVRMCDQQGLAMDISNW